MNFIESLISYKKTPEMDTALKSKLIRLTSRFNMNRAPYLSSLASYPFQYRTLSISTVCNDTFISAVAMQMTSERNIRVCISQITFLVWQLNYHHTFLSVIYFFANKVMWDLWSRTTHSCSALTQRAQMPGKQKRQTALLEETGRVIWVEVSGKMLKQVNETTTIEVHWRAYNFGVQLLFNITSEAKRS